MVSLKYKLRIFAATVLAGATLAVVPVYAQHGSADDSTPGSGVATTSTETEHSSTTGTSDGSGSDSLHDRAEKLLGQERASKKGHTTEQKQLACTKHEDQINNRVSGLGNRAQKHLDVFNTIFTKVQKFHDTKNVDAPNYDALVATATEKQTAATTAVDTLKSLADTKIDCSSSDPAATLATVKAAADDAKTALQAYRTAIKNVIVALQSVNSSANKGTTSNTTTTTNTNSTEGTTNGQ